MFEAVFTALLLASQCIAVRIATSLHPSFSPPKVEDTEYISVGEGQCRDEDDMYVNLETAENMSQASIADCRNACTKAADCGAFTYYVNVDMNVVLCRMLKKMDRPYVQTNTIYKTMCYSNCRRSTNASWIAAQFGDEPVVDEAQFVDGDRTNSDPCQSVEHTINHASIKIRGKKRRLDVHCRPLDEHSWQVFFPEQYLTHEDGARHSAVMDMMQLTPPLTYENRCDLASSKPVSDDIGREITLSLKKYCVTFSKCEKQYIPDRVRRSQSACVIKFRDQKGGHC